MGLGELADHAVLDLIITHTTNGATFTDLDRQAMKLRSSMTLFARASPDRQIFAEVLAMYLDGVPYAMTEALLDKRES